MVRDQIDHFHVSTSNGGVLVVSSPRWVPDFGYVCLGHKHDRHSAFMVYDCTISGKAAVFTWLDTYSSISLETFLLKMLLEHGCNKDKIVCLEDAYVA